MSASSTLTAASAWSSIDWGKAERRVSRLQMRMAKAIKAGRYGKAKALSWLLTHSRSAKLLAIKHVTETKGRKTAGVDGEHWKSASRKHQAVTELNRRGYKAQPLKSITIAKKQGGKRKLGIPTMRDRAMQALYKLALEPWSEHNGDLNSYGFRRERSAHDAMHQLYIILSRKTGAEWILEADIKACFDNISHEWLLSHIPMDKTILRAWLTAGHLSKEVIRWSNKGTPQGGVASPMLANMALDGLENIVKGCCPMGSKVHCIRYADDFVITAQSDEMLRHTIQPVVEQFLKARGLQLSKKKTCITSIHDGFDFLGFNVRKYNGKFITKPSKQSIKEISRKLRGIIKKSYGWSQESLIRALNPRVIGWTNYYRYCCAKSTYGKIDNIIYRALYHWVMRLHQNKSRRKWMAKYFRYRGTQKRWIFVTRVKGKHGKNHQLTLWQAKDTKIRRYIKITSSHNLFDPASKAYFAQRSKWKAKLADDQKRWSRYVYANNQQSRRIASK